jgi:hypothetical protein
VGSYFDDHVYAMISSENAEGKVHSDEEAVRLLVDQHKQGKVTKEWIGIELARHKNLVRKLTG